MCPLLSVTWIKFFPSFFLTFALTFWLFYYNLSLLPWTEHANTKNPHILVFSLSHKKTINLRLFYLFIPVAAQVPDFIVYILRQNKFPLLAESWYSLLLAFFLLSFYTLHLSLYVYTVISYAKFLQPLTITTISERIVMLFLTYKNKCQCVYLPAYMLALYGRPID